MLRVWAVAVRFNAGVLIGLCRFRGLVSGLRVRTGCIQVCSFPLQAPKKRKEKLELTVAELLWRKRNPKLAKT